MDPLVDGALLERPKREVGAEALEALTKLQRASIVADAQARHPRDGRRRRRRSLLRLRRSGLRGHRRAYLCVFAVNEHVVVCIEVRRPERVERCVAHRACT